MQVVALHSSFSRKNTRSGSIGSDDDGTFDVVVPSEGIVLEQVLVGRDKRKSSVSSTARPTVDPDGVVLRRFGNGRVWIDTCRMVELSSVVEASTAGHARLMGQFLL